jgi:RNA polymerase sigma-70 factor (ECF subfamily)
MGTLSRRREEYVGEWLPERLLTSRDVAADFEFAQSVSITMLTVVETLEPTERAVFVLHRVFDTPYREIAEATQVHGRGCGRSPGGLASMCPFASRACR